jgi:hypothetical protein
MKQFNCASNEAFLRYASKCSKKQRNSLIKNASRQEINAICECVFNAYKKNVHLPNRIISRLHPFRKTIVKIARNPKLPVYKKRKIILQQGNGAFLPILLASIIPTIASLFKK